MEKPAKSTGIVPQRILRKGQKLSVWLTDEYGRTFMGKPNEKNCRWRIFGEFVEDEPDVAGFWLRVDHVDQVPAAGKPTPFAIGPPLCLLFWGNVVTVQVHGDKFQPVTLDEMKQ